jgi:hypothetical protein
MANPTEQDAKVFNFMQSGKTVQVKVAKTWDLVCRHRIYSCPDRYEFVRGATFLLLDAGFRDQTNLMKVVDVWKLNPARREGLAIVPLEWRKRLEDYIAEARQRPGILDQSSDYRFYGLVKNTDDDYEREFCTRADDDSWPDWLKAMANIRDLDVQAALALWREKELFFHWPRKAELLWQGVTRHQDGYRQDCYTYPKDVKCRLGREPDGRNNGPAIHAFELSGGERPTGWHIHHVYDGSVVIPGKSERILRAVKHPDYFTHSGGLVAAHPAAHFVAHESELLGWFLRLEAFKRFKFDPDNVFRGCK